MVPTVKICGLATADARGGARRRRRHGRAGVLRRSPRFVGLDHARELAAQRATAPASPLTVDADDALLAAIARVVGPDMLQLHGRDAAAGGGDQAGFACRR